MGNAIVTFKIMPENPGISLEKVRDQAKEIATEAGAKGNVADQIIPIAFGLKQLNILGMYEVKEGNDFDSIAVKMQEIEGVNTAEVAKMDLAMG